MKYIVALCLAISVLTNAAAANVPLGSLPPLVYLLSFKGGVGGQQQGIYAIRRGGADHYVVFRSQQAAASYKGMMRKAESARIADTPLQMPRSQLRNILAAGERVVVDPVSKASGGDLVVVAVEQADTGHDSGQLAELYQADQADRNGKLDDTQMEKRDRTRQAAVKDLYQRGRLGSARDYYHAAMIMHHGSSPEDFLLAHELSMIALAKGEPQAKWLSAATQDRFLISIGRTQRWGTQSMVPLLTDGVVTDTARRELNIAELKELAEQSRNADKSR